MTHAAESSVSDSSLSRRNFIKATTATGAGALVAQNLTGAFAAGSETLKVGLIGCGGRGAGAAKDIIKAAEGIELVAMGDAFKDRLEEKKKALLEDEEINHAIKVDEDHCFVGFDAYRKVIDSGVDVVLLATPPHFRAEHFQAAIEAGKHVFAEKPVATDAFGVRNFIETGKLAKEKNLSVVTGLQRRHQNHYLEAMKKIHAGDLGDVVSLHGYWNGSPLWSYPREEGWSDMEYQMRNWYYYTWLCGDHIVEQHVHNLDVANWAKGDQYPVKCVGMGGREVRTDPLFGHIYDHHAVVYEYEDGTLLTSTCRQMKGCKNDVREVIVGTKGTCYTDGGSARMTGAVEMEWKDSPNPYVQEHEVLVRSIRGGEGVNEAERVAKSTLTAIMGRMATYTGKEITWEMAMNSQEKLGPDKYEWGEMPFPEPAVPGKTPFV
jgi:predicted dehydrogenase